MLISLLVLLHELDYPWVVASERAPGLLVVRPEGRLFFANARRVVDHLAAIAADHRPPPRVVLVDLSAVNDLEITALERLADQAEDLHRQGGALWAAAPTERPLEMLRRAAELLGRTDPEADTGRLGVRVFPSLDEAIAAYEQQTLPDHPLS
jgi:sulfate permease, SulP family